MEQTSYSGKFFFWAVMYIHIYIYIVYSFWSLWYRASSPAQHHLWTNRPRPSKPQKKHNPTQKSQEINHFKHSSFQKNTPDIMKNPCLVDIDGLGFVLFLIKAQIKCHHVSNRHLLRIHQGSPLKGDLNNEVKSGPNNLPKRHGTDRFALCWWIL